MFLKLRYATENNINLKTFHISKKKIVVKSEFYCCLVIYEKLLLFIYRLKKYTKQNFKKLCFN